MICMYALGCTPRLHQQIADYPVSKSKFKFNSKTRNKDCPYIKLIVPTEMMPPLRIPVLYLLSMVGSPM